MASSTKPIRCTSFLLRSVGISLHERPSRWLTICNRVRLHQTIYRDRVGIQVVDDEHFELGTTREPQTETPRPDWIGTPRVADGVAVSCLLSCIWLPLGLLESPVSAAGQWPQGVFLPSVGGQENLHYE